MRSLFFVFALCAAFVGTTVEGWAGAFGSSILNVSNLRLQYKSGVVDGVDVWENATNSQASVSSTFNSQSSATLGALSDASGFTFGNNARQSFVSPTMTAPLEQTMLPLTGLGPSGLNSFARGDTLGSGSTIVSGGTVSMSTLAELNTLDPVSGLAIGNLSNTNTFLVSVTQGGEYRLAFTATLAMQTSGDGFASNSISIDGQQSQSGGGNVFLPPSDFSSLNRSINGTSTVSESGNFFSAAMTLQGGRIATFTVSQNSEAGANNVVPEPSSIAIFGLMSVGSLAAWRRRRAGERKSAEA